MKRFLTAVAVAGFAFGLLAGCNDYNNSIQYNTGATVTNIAPSGLPAGSASFLLTVNASAANGFNTTTVIQWNGQKLSNQTFVDTTTMTATVPANLLTKAGTALVNTLTAQSGTGQNGLSNTMAFTIYGTPNPLPTLTSVTPATAPACGTSCANASVTITVAGTNFLSASNNGGSLVTIADKLTPMQEPTALTITSLSSTQIQAVIPGTYLANPDTATIQVTNPGNGLCTQPSCLPLVGGGNSAPFSFLIGGGAPAVATAMAMVAEETPAISQDGRYVVYSSQQNQVNQILLKDTCMGVTNGCSVSTRVVSVAGDGTAGNTDSHNAVVTSDGRYVAFSSAATNLVEGAPAGRQVYVHDTCIGADSSCKTSTTLISTDSQGTLSGTESILPSISSTGRYVAFVSVTVTNAPKVAGGTAASVQAAPNSGLRQVFVRDTCLGAANCTPSTTRISMVPGDAPANGTKPAGPAISGMAKQIALADGKTATVFTPTVAVDENVVLAIPKQQ
jgi:IPT/TIG domain/WD40-like Beta Propeller Repeat